jgi:hypothetical protein
MFSSLSIRPSFPPLQFSRETSSLVIACYKARMRLLNQFVVTAVSACLLFSVSGCHLHVPDASANEVARITSPDGLVDAVLSEHNGGATTSFGYDVAVASHDHAQVHRVANLYGATRSPQAYGVNLRWASSDHLDFEFFSTKTPPTLYSPVAVGGKSITVTLRSGVIDTEAPPGGMLYNQKRK